MKWVTSNRAGKLLNKYEDLLVDIEMPEKTENSVCITFIGEFNAGKSTVVNAILGKSILPVDVFQTTATINRIKSGLSEGFKVIDHNGKIILEEKSLSKLADFNADSSHEFKSIKWIDITCPSLPEGIELIDTPGFNDPDPIRDQTFLSILPLSDLIVFISDANQALKGSEIPYIKKYFLNTLARSYFVFNHSDGLKTQTRLKLTSSDICNKLKQFFIETAAFFEERSSTELANAIRDVDINKHSFFISAISPIEKDAQKLEQGFFDTLNQDFIRLKNDILSLLMNKDLLREEWIIRSILASLQEKSITVNNTLQLINEYSDRSLDMKTSLFQRLQDQENSYRSVLENLRKARKNMKIFLSDVIEQSIKKVESLIHTNIADYGGIMFSEYYHSEMQSILNNIIEGANRTLQNSILDSIKLTTSTDFNTGAELPFDMNDISRFSRNSNQKMAMANTALTSSSVAAVGALSGDPLVGVITSLGSILITATSHQIEIRKEKQKIERICADILHQTKLKFKKLKEDIQNASERALVKYENQVVKSTNSTQWQIMQLIDLASKQDQSRIHNLEKQNKQLELAIHECRRQIVALRDLL